MIAGLVAMLEDDARRLQATVAELRSRPEVELGAFAATDRRLPLTIDVPSRGDAETITDWIRTRPGVLFVDVVCVHLEDLEDAPAPAADSARSHISEGTA